ncbi:MAG: hypothetical protein AAGJ40_08155 [Planctomycetota bacterium]
MNRFVTACVAISCCFLPGWADESVANIEGFESTLARNAVSKFKERVAFLESRMNQQLDAAGDALREDLKDALASSVAASELREVERISKFLQQKSNDQDQEALSDDVAVLRRQVVELERKLALAMAPDPIVGKWRYHNKNVCDYTADGWVTLNGKAIGIWRRTSDRQYIVAFINTFGKGVSDEMTLSPDGKSIAALGSRGQRFQINRIP